MQRAVLPSPTVVLRAAASTSAGNRRADNEDAHAIGERICVVADGMGGHAAGDVASRLAVDTVVAHPVRDVAALADAVRVANRAVRGHAAAGAGTEGMGATLVAVAVVDTAAGPAVAVVHVGDSRCYRWSVGELRLLTRDHSLVQHLVDSGRLAAADAPHHPMANVVTRAIGADDDVEPDVVVLEPVPCRLLLCTDGLHGELPARAIGRVLAGIDDPAVAAERLVQLALLGAARDNVTAMVIDVDVRLDAGPGILDTPGAVDHHGAATGPALP